TDIDPGKSLYHALVRKGQMRTLVSPDEIEAAKTSPPKDTRAYFRGRVTEKFGEDVLATNWQVMSVQESEVTQGVDTTAHLAHIRLDRKSTRLNSSHVSISYAVFCLKKKIMTIR